jgi:predicted metal-dependent hydrolase
MFWADRYIELVTGHHEVGGETLLKAKSKIIEIDGMGRILFERSHRAKRINISVKPFKGVRVAVPYRVSFDKAIRFAQSKKSWTLKHLDKMKAVEKKHENFLKNSTLIDRAEARKKLVSRLNELSENHGFRYNKVFLKNQKTRWGSCSGKNNINLNMNLIRLPDEMIDYVLLHELVHTRIKNHTKEFWLELDRLVGDAKAKRKRLKEYSIF